MNNRLINTKVAGGGGCTDIVDNYDPFGGGGLALYQLNGNANDVSGNYNGTDSNVTWGGAGVFGTSGAFNGSSSYIENSNIPNEICKGYYTVNVWAYIPSSQPFASVVHFQDDNNGHLPVLNIAANNSNWYIDVRSNSSAILTSTNVPIAFNSWNMITVVLHSGGGKFYLNGVEEASASFSPVFTTNTSCKFSLGRTNQGWISGIYNYLNGSIDQVRIFNTALTPLEVEALYTEELCICDGTVDTLDILGDGSCIATYQLDGNANDLSGNYSGTPTDVSYGVGEFDLAGVFNGTSSFIDTNAKIPASLDFSVSFWMKSSDTSSGNYYIFGTKGSYLTNGWFISNNLGYIIYGEGNGVDNATSQTSPSIVANGNWNHVVVTRAAGGTVNMYVNNSRVITDGSVGTYFMTSSTWAYDTHIGRYAASSILFYDGELDQVRIFNKAVSAGEVTTLYNETPCN
jgi:hypothetical protein